MRRAIAGILDADQRPCRSTCSSLGVHQTLYRVLNVSGSFASSTINLSGVSDMAKAIKVSPHTTSSTTLFIGTETGEIFKVTGANSSTSPTTINITGSNLPSGTVSCIQVGTSENELIAALELL